MAFDIPNSGNVQTGNFRRDRKVDAYINLSLPRTNGQQGKIDRGLRLYFDDPAQKQLFELLQTEEGVERFKSALIVTCNANTVEKESFAL